VAISLAISWWIQSKPRQRFQMPSIAEIGAWALLIVLVAILHPAQGAWGYEERLSDLATGTLSVQSLKDRLVFLIGFTHQFVTRPLWPLTALYVVGFINLTLRRVRGVSASGDHVAWILYVLGSCAWIATAFMTKLYDARYLFAILPFYFLLVCREAQRLLEAIVRSIKLVRIDPFTSLLGLSILVVVLLAPATLRSANEKDSGLLPAFTYVRENLRDGDVVAAEATAASLLLLDRADYYVRQRGAEIINGFNIVTGAPLLRSSDELLALMHEQPRVWFVVEGVAWERHFDSEFRQTILDTMDLAFYRKHTFVFVSSKPDSS
jgi:hypothetical protein